MKYAWPDIRPLIENMLFSLRNNHVQILFIFACAGEKINIHREAK